MKRLSVIGVLTVFLGALMPAAFAQSNDNDNKNHGDFGVYFDWTRLQFAKLNMFGVGARVGFNLRSSIVLEGEMAYDFEQSTSQTIISGGTTNTFTSNLRLIHGLIGPKIQFTHGSIRFFVVAKGGLLNFGVGGPVTAGTFAKQIGAIKDGDTNGVFYPGGGVEFNIGKIGFRLDAGDEIFFDNGLNHNLKVTAGPQIRF